MRLSGLTGFAALLLFAAPAFAAMTLTSPDIRDGAAIASAQIYPRCGGENVSPALAWSGVPAGARSLVLTMIDMDVKPADWSHWIVVDLPPSATGLAGGTQSLPDGAIDVPSDFGDSHYDGPCPPAGSGVHHYRFTIWAMPDAKTEVPRGMAASDLDAMLARRALDKAMLTGSVER